METACFVSCGKGFFCDHGTRACETCRSICDPLRNTMEYCLSVLECKDYHTTTALPRDVSTPLTSSASDLSNVLIIITILGVCLIIAVVVVLLYRRRKRRTNTSICVCWSPGVKTPVPISIPEQDPTGNPYIFQASSNDSNNSSPEMVPLKIQTSAV